ncbi:MAG TPA: hypothetical protein VFA04_10555 [Bryobacteraceae bacterium]|nr:hypothetical protein [Bryobacteraceae bacterium]
MTFTVVPNSGAGGAFTPISGFPAPTLSNGNTVAVVSVDSQGYATSPQLTANSTAGSFTVTANDGTNTEVFNVTTTACISNPPVTALTDTGAAGELRGAVNTACAGSTIDLTALSETITLGSRIRIDDLLTINGPGAGTLAIDGGGVTRLFFIGGGAVSINDLTLQHGLGKGGDSALGGGAAGMGGAIFQNGGNLQVSGVTFLSNTAQGGGPNSGLGGGGFGGNANNGGGPGGDLFGIAGENAGPGAGGSYDSGNGGFGGGGAYGSNGSGRGGFGAGGGGSYIGSSGGQGGFAAANGTGTGGHGGAGAGFGGAVFQYAGTLALTNDTFMNNSAVGGTFPGGGDGQGKGGAIFIYADAGATATASGLTFTGSTAAQDGVLSTGSNIGSYSSGLCPGADTVNLCGILGPVTVSITGGNNQQVSAGSAFSSLQVKVTDGVGNLLSGIAVTFTAPASGASGTFSNSTNTITASTASDGTLSEAFTANSTAGGYSVILTVAGVASAPSFSLTNVGSATAVQAVSPTTTISALVNTQFSAPLVVKVTDSNNNPVSGATVTFTPPVSGASATLTSPAPTDANGETGVTATANGTAGGPYTVTASVAGGSTSATFSLTNTLSEQPPTIGTYNAPAGGHGSSGQFQFQFSDPNGAADIARAWMVFNASFSPLNACQVSYIASVNRFYLLSDDGTRWVGSVAAGGSGTLTNSQCTLNAATSTASPSGSTLTVTLDLTFTPTFGGTKQAWAYVLDGEGEHAGWTDVGAWTVGPGGEVAPQLGTVTTPAGGFGTGGQFQFQFSDGNGAADIARTWMLFGNNSSPANACQVSYIASVGRFYLLADNGSGWVGSVMAGGSGTLSNSQCTLKAATSTAATSGNTLTVTLDLTFTAGFAGTKQIWGYVLDVPGQHDGWRQISSWIVGSGAEQPPMVGALSAPAGGSGSGGQFQFQFSDPNGAADISRVWMLFNSTFTPVNACQVSYIASVNRFYLLNDAGTANVGSSPPGGGALQNSQCTLNAVTSTVASSGNTITVTLDLTFTTPGFDGTKQIWGYALDGAGQHGGWTHVGNWNVQ